MNLVVLEGPKLNVPNALSIDLEYWHHAQLVRRHLRDKPVSDRIVESTQPILDILTQYDQRATFFVVGEVMRRHPALVQDIHNEGHEVGCHSMTHRPLWELTPAAFGEELAAFSQLSRRVLGAEVKIRGFRAPTFSLDRRTGWAVPVLERWGYEYDASIFPVGVGLYGEPDAPIGIYRLSADDPSSEDLNGHVIEFPSATVEIFRWRLPVGGGTYLRLLPIWFLRRVLERVNRERPFSIYLHPWETDRGTPRIGLPAWAEVVTYSGIDSTLEKLETLLEAFRFTTVHESLGAWEDAQSVGARKAAAPLRV